MEEEGGEVEEGRGEEEEVRGAVGLGGAEGGGGRGGDWWMGDGSGLSFGAKPREFPKLSNHSTLQAQGEDRGGSSGVVADSGGSSEWRHGQEPEASSEELAYLDPRASAPRIIPSRPTL
jgi:hypothetical protein